MVNRVFQPGSYKRRVVGRSVGHLMGGSILLEQGGPGAGSSYPSVADYEQETGQHVGMEGVNAKLKSLMVPPLKKKKNIRFSLN